MTDSAGSHLEQFQISQRPYREFTLDGSATMRNSIRIMLHPAVESLCLNSLIKRVLDADHYTVIPWNGFPAPVYLVHDERTASAVRVLVLDGNIALDVLPKTTETGLAEFVQSVQSASNSEWDITRS